ncbi:hypothetical protein MNBD_NITROSPIRAE01-2013 [hydrothermal vent metagenome]|uniref:Uncharacterized protein n=1 Tax=hydrothermal vent metagenome TaxID=652676 RepID=A0A3B1D4J7_9ZZZZ
MRLWAALPAFGAYGTFDLMGAEQKLRSKESSLFETPSKKTIHSLIINPLN